MTARAGKRYLSTFEKDFYPFFQFVTQKDLTEISLVPSIKVSFFNFNIEMEKQKKIYFFISFPSQTPIFLGSLLSIQIKSATCKSGCQKKKSLSDAL